MIKQNITPFIHTQNERQLLLKVTLMMCLNQSVLQLHQRYKDFQEYVQDGLMIQL